MTLKFQEIDRSLAAHAELTRSFDHHRTLVTHAVFDPHLPQSLITITENGFVQVVDLEKSTFKLMLLHLGGTPLEARYRTAALSPALFITHKQHLQLLFSLSHSNELLCGDLADGAVSRFARFRARPSAIHCDGDYIATGDSTGAVSLWRGAMAPDQAADAALLWQRQLLTASVSAITISRDVMVLSGDDYAVKVVNVATGESLASLLTEACRVPALLGLPPPSDALLLLSERGSITFYTPASPARTTWNPLHVVHSIPVACATVHTGGFLAIGGTNGRVVLYDVSRIVDDTDVVDQPLACYDLGHAIRLAVVTDDSYFVVVTAAGDVWRWPLADVLPEDRAALRESEARVAEDDSGHLTDDQGCGVDSRETAGVVDRHSEPQRVDEGPTDASPEPSHDEPPRPTRGTPSGSCSASACGGTTSALQRDTRSRSVASNGVEVSISAARFSHERDHCTDDAADDAEDAEDVSINRGAGVEFHGHGVPNCHAADNAALPTVINMDDDEDDTHEDFASSHLHPPEAGSKPAPWLHGVVPTPPQEPFDVASNPTTHRTCDGEGSDVVAAVAPSLIPSTVQQSTHNQTREDIPTATSLSQGSARPRPPARDAGAAQDDDQSAVQVRSSSGSGGGHYHNDTSHRSPAPASRSARRACTSGEQPPGDTNEPRDGDEIRDAQVSVSIPGLKEGRRMDPREARATVERAARQSLGWQGGHARHELSAVHENSSAAVAGAAAATAVDSDGTTLNGSYISADGRFDARKYAEEHKTLAQALEFRFAIPAQNFSRDEILFDAVGLTAPAAPSSAASPPQQNPIPAESRETSGPSQSPRAPVDELVDATFVKFVRKRDEALERQRAKPGPDIRRHLCDALLFPSRGSSTVFFSEHAAALPPPEPLLLPLPVPPTPTVF